MRYGVFVERHRALIYSYYSASTFERMEMLGWCHTLEVTSCYHSNTTFIQTYHQ